MPSDERVEGTIATSVLAVVKNSLFVRVHNVKEKQKSNPNDRKDIRQVLRSYSVG